MATRSMSTAPFVMPHARRGGHKGGRAKERVDSSQLAIMKGELTAAPADRNALMLYTTGVGSHVGAKEWTRFSSYSCISILV
jgi:hypothetical protein